MSQTPSKVDQIVSEHQATLLYRIEQFFGRQKLPKELRRAFLNTQRHRFAKKFYSSHFQKWISLDEQNVSQHLAELYADHPLSIYRDENGRSISTISQPSLVVYMLDLLGLKPGMSVFELGGGSGWNAALMGQLVGPDGYVFSLEIVDALVPNAQEAVASLNLPQVTIMSGDGSDLPPELPPFDRGIFTASAWDLPSCFYQKIKQEGLLLLVLKGLAHFDLLTVLRKKEETHFESELQFTCSFVPVTGSKEVPVSRMIAVSSLTDLELANEFEWSDIKVPDTDIVDFLNFVKLVYDCQESYLVAQLGTDFDEEFWGIRDPQADSLVLFNEDRILLYGTEESSICVRRAAKRWLKAGKPSLEELKLSLYSTGSSPEPSNDQWLVLRGESTLLWSL